MPNYTNNVGKSALLRYLTSSQWIGVCVCVCARLFVSIISCYILSHSPVYDYFWGSNSSTGLNRRLSACQSIDGAHCCCFHLRALTIWQTFRQGLCENDSAKMVAAHQRCYNFSCIKKHQIGKLLQGMVTADRSWDKNSALEQQTHPAFETHTVRGKETMFSLWCLNTIRSHPLWYRIITKISTHLCTCAFFFLESVYSTYTLMWNSILYTYWPLH